MRWLIKFLGSNYAHLSFLKYLNPKPNYRFEEFKEFNKNLVNLVSIFNFPLFLYIVKTSFLLYGASIFSLYVIAQQFSIITSFSNSSV